MKFYVEGTDLRPRSNQYYISQMSRENYHKYGKHIVVEHLHQKGLLKIIAENYPVDGIKDNVIRMDQSIRSGLGIERNNDELTGYTEQVTVYRLHVPLIKRISNAIASLFGYRYLVMRFNRPRVADAEKKIVRAADDSFSLLGIENNDHIILEYPVQENEQYVLKCVSVECLMTGGSYESMLPSAICEIGNETHDLPKIFVDYEIAKHIYLPSTKSEGKKPPYIDLQPIMVRRDIFRILLKHIMQFSFGVFMTVLGLSSTINNDSISSTSVIILSIALSFVITLIKIRSTL